MRGFGCWIVVACVVVALCSAAPVRKGAIEEAEKTRGVDEVLRKGGDDVKVSDKAKSGGKKNHDNSALQSDEIPEMPERHARHYVALIMLALVAVVVFKLVRRMREQERRQSASVFTAVPSGAYEVKKGTPAFRLEDDEADYMGRGEHHPRI